MSGIYASPFEKVKWVLMRIGGHWMRQQVSGKMKLCLQTQILGVREDGSMMMRATQTRITNGTMSMTNMYT